MGPLRMLAAVAVAAGALVGCDSDARPPLRIWAAASLSEAVPNITRAFRQTEGRDHPIEHSFDASSRLAMQIAEGAPADLILSADREWIEFLEAEGRLAPDGARAFASNRLVVIVPRGRPKPVDLPSLVRGVDRLGLAGEGVPAGRYADAALAEADLTHDAAPKIVRGGHVRSVLAWVADAEVDAGIVYRTDAMSSDRVDVAIDSLPGADPEYVGAVTANAADPQRAARYLEYLTADAGATLDDSGFGQGNDT